MKRKLRQDELNKKTVFYSMTNIPDGTVIDKMQIQFNNQMTQVYGLKVEYINMSPFANFVTNDGSQGSIVLCTSSKLSGCTNRDQACFIAQNDFALSPVKTIVGVPAPSVIGQCVVANYTGVPTLFNGETKSHDAELNAYYSFYHPCDLDDFDFSLTSADLKPLTVKNAGGATKCSVELIISFYVPETK